MSAEGLRSLPDSAGGLGMVGARMTLLDDPSVVRANPASMGQITDSSLMLNFQAWHGETDFKSSATGAEDSMILNWKLLGSIYSVIPLSEKLSFGFGVSVPFGLSINWPRDGAFRYTAPYDAVLETVALNPALSYELTDWLSVGAGLDVFYSRLKLDQAFPWFIPLGAPTPDGDLTMEGTGWGIGSYMGINVQIAERHRLAFTGRLPVTVSYQGEATWSNVPGPLAGVFKSRTDFGSEIQFPGSIGVGYAWDITDRLAVGVEYEWIQNSTHDDLPLEVGGNQALLGGDGLSLKWKDSYSTGIGLRYRATKNLTLRAGYLYSSSPLRDSTYIPSVPANDRHLFSIGGGYTRGKNTIDVSYTFMPMESRSVRGASQPAFNGDYDYNWNVLALSYTRRF